MTVIVFGGTGLVGQALKKYQPNWIYLGSKDGDLRNMKECKYIFEKYKPQKIVFLAALVGGLYRNIDENYNMYMDNMKMQINIIECCNKFEVQVKEGIFCLSTCVFPNKIHYPIREEYLHNGEPHPSNYGYAYAKRNMEIMCRLSNERYGSKFQCISPTNIYGEYDNFSLKNGHVIPCLIHKAYLASRDKTNFVILGSGKPLRQFIYSDDIAQIIIILLMNPFLKAQRNLIVTPFEELSIGIIGLMIAKNFKISNDKIKFNTEYTDGQFKKTCSNEKLLEHIGHFEFTLIENGLERTIDWFKKNYPNMRM